MECSRCYQRSAAAAKPKASLWAKSSNPSHVFCFLREATEASSYFHLLSPFPCARWLQTNTMRPKTLQTSSLWTVEGPPLLVEAIFASPRSHVSRPPGKPPPTTSSCLPPFPATRGSPPPPACAPHTNHCCVFMFKSFQFGSKVQLPPCDAIPWDHHHHTPITSYHQKPIQVENFCQDPVWYVLMLESFL